MIVMADRLVRVVHSDETEDIVELGSSPRKACLLGGDLVWH